MYDELQKIRYSKFSEITAKMNELASKYGSLPSNSLMQAFGNVNGDVSIQNRRVKSIGSTATKYSKTQVEEMLKDASSHERQLREVEKSLEITSYPLHHTRTVYQNLLTYHSYVAPYINNKGDAKKDDFWREWKLLEKLRTELEVKSVTHEIVGEAIQEGKVFYYPRYSVDKSHNKVHFAFMQQLPSDFVKIVGFNNKSKYTLAFDMMYFTQAGTDYRQFGDLFTPYITEFSESVSPKPKVSGGKYIYAQKTELNQSAFSRNADAYGENGRWYYWVTLPIDQVFTFEIDDVSRDAITPFTGLLLDMLQLSQLEALQLELLSNPLVAVLHGEIPYFETKDTNTADQYKLSNAGRLLFESLWYQMTARNNAGGIGLYAAPLKNMTLSTLPEAPNATNIVSSGYQDVMNKAGLSGIIPTNYDTRAGLAEISLQIECQFAQGIYRCMERMMNTIIERLNLKYDFRFAMFGDIASDKSIREECKKDMSLGLLPSVIIYNALYDRSIMEDLSWSETIKESGVLDARIPLVTSYTMSPDAKLPPVGDKGDEGGRPKEDETGESTEESIDSGEVSLN